MAPVLIHLAASVTDYRTLLLDFDSKSAAFWTLNGPIEAGTSEFSDYLGNTKKIIVELHADWDGIILFSLFRIRAKWVAYRGLKSHTIGTAKKITYHSLTEVEKYFQIIRTKQ